MGKKNRIFESTASSAESCNCKPTIYVLILCKGFVFSKNLTQKYKTLYNIPNDTLFVGKNLIELPSCQSTNDEAAALLNQQPNVAEGSLIVTPQQTGGRGQRGNTWLAVHGQNITCSFILKPTFLLAQQQFALNVVAALAIAEMLQTVYGVPQVQIKWPNDVYVADQKIAGILIENSLQGNKIVHSIVGIGLNVNQTAFDAPNATSLQLQTAQTYDTDAVLSHLCSSLEKQYMLLRGNQYNVLKTKYLAQMYRRGENALFLEVANNTTFAGEIIGFNDLGQLAIRTAEQLRYFSFQEVRYL
jgi:BirA family biotin operon repressor/biotin-[acetyl-CoA-carboxylase] ligase